MPPKQKGQSSMGKHKLFRHAVQHVRLGLGHTVLGNLNLELAAGSRQRATEHNAAADGVTGHSSGVLADRPAFYLELNEQLLSHSSKDFKKFRWEVLELCETQPLFHLHHRQIAQKLLVALMQRTGETAVSTVTSKKRHVDGSEKAGMTVQAFEAFVRLTIAFARDMGDRFFAYFEVFQQAVQAGLFDEKGNFISDADRLQLVYAAQAAWCREMREYWGRPEHAALVQRIVRVYVVQMKDTKEYVRRLAAELLAFLCRVSHASAVAASVSPGAMMALIVEEGCGEVLSHFQQYMLRASRTGTTENEDSEQSDEEDSEEAETKREETTASPSHEQMLLAYVRDVLPQHPVVDGLQFFATEVFRSMKGALSSSFETNYVRLLHAFLLTDVPAEKRVADVVDFFCAVHHPLEPFLDAVQHHDEDETEWRGPTGTPQGTDGSRPLAPFFRHAWSGVFYPPLAPAAEALEEVNGENSNVQLSQSLVQQLGKLVIAEALCSVMRETHQSVGKLRAMLKEQHRMRRRRQWRKEHGLPEISDGEEEEDYGAMGGFDGEVDEESDPDSGEESGANAPRHRLLAAAVWCLPAPSAATAGPLLACHVAILSRLMGAVDCLLWRDGGEADLMKQLARHLLSALQKTANPSNVPAQVTLSAAVLHLTLPLCLSSRLAGDAHALQCQQLFLPVAKLAIKVCSALTQRTDRSRKEVDVWACEAAAQVLFAVFQDILQKNYAHCVEQERRLAEQSASHGSASRGRAEDEGDVNGSHGPSARGRGKPNRRANDMYDDREGNYVPSDEEEEEHADREGPSQAAKSERGTVRRKSESASTSAIASQLTPFALTILNDILVLLVNDAAAAVSELTAEESQGSVGEVYWSAYRSRSVERGVLLVRMANDQTPHMKSSPLRQLLRLKAMKETDKKGKTTSVKDSSAAALNAFIRLLLSTYVAEKREMSMSRVLCVLPAIHLIAFDAAKEQVNGDLVELLSKVLECAEATTLSGSAGGAEETMAVHSKTYAMYAEVATLLVQLSAAHPATGKKKRGGAANALALRQGDVGLHHLSKTVVMLVRGFERLHHGGEAAAVLDAERLQLLRGAEVLLRALLWLLGVDDDEARSQSSLHEGSGEGDKLPPHTHHALRLLRDVIPAETQSLFVERVLLESLTAPFQSVRLYALRLLQLLTHPALPVDGRLSGAEPVSPSLFNTLIAAEEFNPLSHVGNLEGMRKILSRLLYDAESGKLVKPFERVVLARAMIGLLYVKFTEAWSVASKMLCALVAQERTTLLPKKAPRTDSSAKVKSLLYTKSDSEQSDTDGEGDAEGSATAGIGPLAGTAHSAAQREKLEPVVWTSVVCAYARSLILGDVLARQASVIVSSPPIEAKLLNSGKLADSVASSIQRDAAVEQLSSMVCVYELRLTDQQRHTHGEMVSQLFAQASSGGSSPHAGAGGHVLVDATRLDGELLDWRVHWQASDARGDQDAKSSSALFRGSTDRPTLAQTFLKLLEDMMKSSSALDRKIQLVEDVVLELVALDRGQHLSGVDGSQLKRLSQRLELAMRACSVAPTSVLSGQQRKRASDDLCRATEERNRRLADVFLSYISEADGRLQKAAVENLKRLRVEPFTTYYNQLVPYSEPMKQLFTFLSSFHVETDVPVHDRVEYIATALSLSLPKLLTKVSKEKLKDQAVLSRRLMGYLEHLPSPAESARVGAADPLSDIFDRLLDRLLFSSLSTRSLDFLNDSWTVWVEREAGRYSTHCIRRLDRLAKQLHNALRLLEVMLHAVGRRFSVYVPTCLRLAMQAYVVANKHALRRPVEEYLAKATAEVTGESATHLARTQRWVEQLTRLLSSSSLTSALAQVRKQSVTVATLLFEQFPEELMESEVAPSLASPAPLMTRFIRDLAHNARGNTMAGKTTGALGGVRGGAGDTAYVTPLLRLVTAWLRAPELLCLIPLYSSEVTETLCEVFAVNSQEEASGKSGAPIHRASSQAVFDGLRCVAEMLTLSDEEIDTALLPPAKKMGAGTRQKVKTTSTLSLRECFLEEHMVPIFASLYRLLTSGAERDGSFSAQPAAIREDAAAEYGADDNVEEEAAALGSAKGTAKGQGRPRLTSAGGRKALKRSSSASGVANGGRFSVMSLSVSMWREVMKTISLLSAYLRTSECSETRSRKAKKDGEEEAVPVMIARLLELSLKFVTHPVCITDAQTARTVTSTVYSLMEQVDSLDRMRHWQPFVHLFNVVTNPFARKSLCETMRLAVSKLDTGAESSPALCRVEAPLYRRQMEAAARAVTCLNSFENDETMERYDFDLRYHTLRSLADFFQHYGVYTVHRRGEQSGSKEPMDAARHERAYTGAEDVLLPVDKSEGPVLCHDALALLTANMVFFLRDPETTIRGLAGTLITSVIKYISAGGRQPLAHSNNGSGAKGKPQKGDAEVAQSASLQQMERRDAYRNFNLEFVIRRMILSSLRRGVVAKDVHVRHAHMQAFEGLGRYFASEFPSFALLYAPNTEQNFYANVGHVQHRPRQHALGLLREQAPHMLTRDLLRVFVPFLMSAVKDFAEGKRNLMNLTEGRAKGYCDGVLLTMSAIAQHLPWAAYYRVLSLFLTNASANASLRGPMLRGVVQVLESFHFLDEKGNEKDGVAEADAKEEDDGDDDVEDDNEEVMAELRAKKAQFHRARIMHVLEVDILPQLYSYIGDRESRKGAAAKGAGPGQHSVTAVRREQEKEEEAHRRNALLQLPVAVSITRIVKHFAEDRFNHHVDHLLDEIVKKLRTKNDKHRESARRILGAMVQETGPSKLKFIVSKLKDNLVHGYQLHVLGYTVVSLLLQLYEPVREAQRRAGGKRHAAAAAAAAKKRAALNAAAREDVAQAALDEANQTHQHGGDGRRRRLDNSAAVKESDTEDEGDDNAAEDLDGTNKEIDLDTAVERAEEAMLQRLTRSQTASFTYEYGVECLTDVMDDLMLIFLDDYLGEVGLQKTQVEVMSSMVEVKKNRALRGFVFLGRHCQADAVMERFLSRITWVLTPPSDARVNVDTLHGSARARAMLMQELKTKYVSTSKQTGADLLFVTKVRTLAVRVARAIMVNPTMSVERSFKQVRHLLEKHNVVREAKISAFEAKDGTRRIRGNAHLLIHKADHQTRKEQLDSNFLVAPVPERVDVDFSSHTVLATQQKQKLRVYKGRYGKEVKEAARDFYREDPATAVVLDTIDEFLLRVLLSVLKQVLGIGKEKRHAKTSVKLDLLRRHRERAEAGQDGDDSEDEADDELDPTMRSGRRAKAQPTGDDNSDEEGEEEDAQEEEEEEEEDFLEDFAENQVVAEDEAAAAAQKEKQNRRRGGAKNSSSPSAAPAVAVLKPGGDLTVSFTREHRDLLESMVPVVLSCLQGEGSDAVVANAMDCLLALVSLRPPLDAVQAVDQELFHTVVNFIQRGDVIKQRSLRLAAAVVAHQKFTLTETNASVLLKIIRAEVMERTPYLAVSLSLLYAVLGKHTHAVEIYDLMDVVMELLVHWAARKTIRRRCILAVVRFLLEFRITPEKFKSHIDMICKNLDYPEVAGCIALLELIDALILRLPTEVLRGEAPVLLVPLSATITSSEWVESREKAGAVVQRLAVHAGVDVLVPLLASWMAATESRPTRAMGAQVWATILPALASFYRREGGATETAPGIVKSSSGRAHNGEDEEEETENKTNYQACCAWSVPAVLQGCLYGQRKGGATSSTPLRSVKEREKAEGKGWSYVFFSLRCAEVMLAALPSELYPLLGPSLLPHLAGDLVTHTHPWVRAAALRILRQYLYVYVESCMSYMQEEHWRQVALSPSEAHENSEADDTLYVVAHLVAAENAAELALSQMEDFAALVKRLVGNIATSDVTKESHNAHRAIAAPSRADTLKILVYAIKAMSHLALFALAAPETVNGHGSTSLAHVQARIERCYSALRRQVGSLAVPVLRQGSLVNYMVRSATLIQFIGGWISMLPREAESEEENEDSLHQTGVDRYNACLRWLVQQALCPEDFLAETALPILQMGIKARPLSQMIANFALQGTTVVLQQLESRRHALTGEAALAESLPVEDALVDDDADGEKEGGLAGRKRARQAGEAKLPTKKKRRVLEAPVATPVSLDEVLKTLQTSLSTVHEAQRDQQTIMAARKSMKRSRHEMVVDERNRSRAQQQMRRQRDTGSVIHAKTFSSSGKKKK